MEKKHNIFQIDSFTTEQFKGNPAGVTFADSLNDSQIALIAREMNLSETAFLTRGEGSEYNLRWFTPSNEVKLCGHGTIAALHFLHENGLLFNDSSVVFNTLSGKLQCGMSNNIYYMQIPIYTMNEFEDNKSEILTALGLPESGLAPHPFILLENGNLYICVRSLEILKKVEPDFKALLSLSSSIPALEGFVLFTTETFTSSAAAHIRYFVPLHGISEDPVTGSANGPLLLVMLRLGLLNDEGNDVSAIFEQGDFMDRDGRIGVHFSPSKNELYISGSAVTVMKGEIVI